jgi:hypothetical protein
MGGTLVRLDNQVALLPTRVDASRKIKNMFPQSSHERVPYYAHTG